jgi:hypothetical protein
MPGISQAVRVQEDDLQENTDGNVWKYALPPGATHPTEDLRVRFRLTDNLKNQWTGLFECASRRQVKILHWPEASSIVVAASNALYIVDPSRPGQFSGFVAPIEINDVAFDESRRNMFIAESLRIYAFSADGVFRWISEPLGGYGARFASCHGRVLTVEIKQSDRNGEHEFSSQLRLRTEDGTLLRSRFRLARGHREKSAAA